LTGSQEETWNDIYLCFSVTLFVYIHCQWDSNYNNAIYNCYHDNTNRSVQLFC